MSEQFRRRSLELVVADCEAPKYSARQVSNLNRQARDGVVVEIEQCQIRHRPCACDILGLGFRIQGRGFGMVGFRV